MNQVQRTWYRKQSDGTFFRNIGLVRLDQARLRNKLPWRRAALDGDQRAMWRAGIIRAAALPPGDRYLDYDDSPEATRIWAARFTASRGAIV